MFYDLLQVLFIGLKLSQIIDRSWTNVLIPTWIFLCIIIIESIISVYKKRCRS